MWYILATCDYFCCYYFANFQYYKKQVAQVAELAIIKNQNEKILDILVQRLTT